MAVTLFVGVRQQLGGLAPGWVTIRHVVFFHEWVRRLIAEGYARIVLDVSLDATDVSEEEEQNPLKI